MSIRITDNMQKKHDIRLSSQTLEIVVEMKKLINQFYDPRRSNDSAFVDVHELMISEELTDDEDDEDADGGELARSGWVTNVASELASANTTLSKSINVSRSGYCRPLEYRISSIPHYMVTLLITFQTRPFTLPIRASTFSRRLRPENN